MMTVIKRSEGRLSMIRLFRRKNADVPVRSFDKTEEDAALRKSICTGEKVAGFLNKKTGHFTEVRLIRSDADLSAFLKEYGITEKDLKEFY
jgi:hypothetical protein